MKKGPIIWIAVLIIGVATVDLLFGNTDKPILPSFIGNVLTQQWDIILIAIGVLMFLL